MAFGLFPVYCQTPAAHCSTSEILIAYRPANTKAKCIICGRWSYYEPGRGDNKRGAKCQKLKA